MTMEEMRLVSTQSSADDIRLLNPPAVRLTCLPHADKVVFEPINISSIPSNSKKQGQFFAAAQAQNIYIDYKKVGPFDEDRGTIKASCHTADFKLDAEFRYTNYPLIFSKDGIKLIGEDQCSNLNNLELLDLSVNGMSWGAWSKFTSNCVGPKIQKLTVHPQQGKTEACFSSGKCTTTSHPVH
ncbi:MAG: hypothetical protein OXQ96_02560 [Alphaproteobacteria bacterium]|nr:hypothetical protein [Alphaproteobacteria bacterium]